MFIMECHLAVTKNEILSFAAKLVELEKNILGKMSDM